MNLAKQLDNSKLHRKYSASINLMLVCQLHEEILKPMNVLCTRKSL